MTKEEIDRVRLHQQVYAIREMLFLAAKCPEAVPYSAVLGDMRYMAERMLLDIENRPPLSHIPPWNASSWTSPQSGVMATPVLSPSPSPNVANVPVSLSQAIAKAWGIPRGVVPPGPPLATVDDNAEQDDDAQADKPDRKQQEMDFFFGKAGER